MGSPGSIGSGGDQYVGLDQFGRVVNQNWVNASTGQSADNFTYSYDANSNVLSKDNVLNGTRKGDIHLYVTFIDEPGRGG
ncbi:hypothetical protein B1B_18154 [mine drainage metagenome]|uniref:YD repeat-containing protein n=1 Tax=mine drainage metagenome TaxID=410659 RepID=T0ZNN9_9ZZZZ